MTSLSVSPSLEKDDWAGEEGSSDDRMLAKVEVRSRLPFQPDVKSEEENGFEVEGAFVRWGIEPARSRDSNAEFELGGADDLIGWSGAGTDGLNGLVDGVGRELFVNKACWTFTPLIVPTGENLEGTVPALTRRAGLFNEESV